MSDIVPPSLFGSYHNGTDYLIFLPLWNSFFRRIPAADPLDAIVSPVLFHNGCISRNSLPLREPCFAISFAIAHVNDTVVPPSLFDSFRNGTDSQGGRRRLETETRAQVLQRAPGDCAPSEGEQKTRGNCTPSEGGRRRLETETRTQVQGGRRRLETETRAQVLQRAPGDCAPSEGEQKTRENCTPSEGGRRRLETIRWWRKAVSPGTFRMGIRGRAGEGGLWGRAAYNESDKVVEKGHFTRHLPDGDPGQGRRGRPLGQGGL